MSEDKVNTQPAETNSEPNNSTQAVDKNDVPYGRFQEVNQAKNQFKSENEELKDQVAKLKAVQEQARQDALKKNSEFETLYNETNSELSKYKEQNKAMKSDLNTFREGLVNQVPEEKRYITENMSIENLQKFVQDSSVTTNAVKTDTSRAGNTGKGEFGGYDSYVEWAEKDPVSYEKEKRNTIGQGIKIAYTGN